jgi:hypothetical protein
MKAYPGMLGSAKVIQRKPHGKFLISFDPVGSNEGFSFISDTDPTMNTRSVDGNEMFALLNIRTWSDPWFGECKKIDEIKEEDIINLVNSYETNPITYEELKRFDYNNLDLETSLSKKKTKTSYDNIYLHYGKKIIIPLRTSQNVRHLEGNKYIFPSDIWLFSQLSRERLFYYTRVSMYKADEFKQDSIHLFPRLYEATLEQGTIKPQFILHGFIEPERLHYHVLKHFPQEKWWTEIIEDAPPICMKQIMEIANGEDEDCNIAKCVSDGAFAVVHPQFRELCHKYMAKAVTFWGASTTDTVREMRMIRIADTICYGEVLVINKKTRKVLKARGSTFNWGDQQPIFHLHLVTYYPDERANLNWIKDKLFKLIPDPGLTMRISRLYLLN